MSTVFEDTLLVIHYFKTTGRRRKEEGGWFHIDRNVTNYMK